MAKSAIQPALVATKDKRWLRTRQQLIRAGFELVGEQGIIGVNIDDITSRAAISKQTFYNHFPDREAFFLELRHQSRTIFETIVAHDNVGIDNPLVRVTRGVAIYGRMAMVDPFHARFFAQSASHDTETERGLNRDLEADLREGLETGQFLFRTIRSAVHYIGGLAQVLVAQLLEAGSDEQAIAITQDILTMLLRGLGVPLDEAERRAAQSADAVFRIPREELHD